MNNRSGVEIGANVCGDLIVASRLAITGVVGWRGCAWL
jgi:hypothetical protein